ncbi:MAG TPA: substrate-binding domain-containing protein [Conexibacter sp.]|jgi:ABC-type sugar transport system substrate-binding protein|nr:substrate-binding domain-containing protein [Conexibacter sp.]
MSEELEGPRVGRRQVLTGAAAFAGASLVAACGSGGGTQSATATGSGGTTVGSGKRRKVVWALAAIAPWNLDTDLGFIEATRTLGWDYQKVGIPIAQYSPENVVRVIDQAVLTQPDVLVTPAWVPGVAQAAADAQKQGILVIFNNANNIPRDAERLDIAFNGSNERAAGAKMGALFADALGKAGKKSGKVVAGVGFAGNANLNERVYGAEDSIKAYNAKNGTSFTVELFVDDSGRGTENAINAYKAKMLQVGGDLVGFLIAGGQSSLLGLLPALKSSGRKPGDYTIGLWDESEDAAKAIKDGWAIAVVTADGYVQGYLPVFQAWEKLERGGHIGGYDSGGLIIDKTNVDASLARRATMNALGKRYGVKLA